MDSNIQAFARIQVIVEIKAGVWAGNSSVDQLFESSAREAKARVLALVQKGNPEARVLGEPVVIAVLGREFRREEGGET
jgi:hypothetical protein